MGAWIETLSQLTRTAPLSSRPAWARGLKLHILANDRTSLNVAPRVGAWIETCLLQSGYYRLLMVTVSRPAWARGLKQKIIN